MGVTNPVGGSMESAEGSIDNIVASTQGFEFKDGAADGYEMDQSAQTRRSFLRYMGLAGIAAALSPFYKAVKVNATDPSYGAVPPVKDMYEWDGIYTKEKDLGACPGMSGKLTMLDTNKLRANIDTIAQYFKDSGKFINAITRLTDGKISNEEISLAYITNDNYFVLRVSTKDDSISKMKSQSEEDMKLFGPSNFYVVAIKTQPRYAQLIKSQIS